MKLFRYISILIVCLSLTACGVYSFTGVTETPETFQVNFFQNNAPLIEPGLDIDFTNALQDLIQNQTSSSLVKSGGEVIYEGEIVEYRISPTTATVRPRAAGTGTTGGYFPAELAQIERAQQDPPHDRPPQIDADADADAKAIREQYQRAQGPNFDSPVGFHQASHDQSSYPAFNSDSSTPGYPAYISPTAPSERLKATGTGTVGYFPAELLHIKGSQQDPPHDRPLMLLLLMLMPETMRISPQRKMKFPPFRNPVLDVT